MQSHGDPLSRFHEIIREALGDVNHRRLLKAFLA